MSPLHLPPLRASWAAVAGWAVVLSWIILAAPAQAGSVTPGENCSLAQAITSANDDSAPAGSSCADGSGEDYILLDRSYYLTSALPDISSEIQIHGALAGDIHGNGTFRIFNVTSGGKLTLANTTIGGGNAGAADGGAVYVASGGELSASLINMHSNRAARGGAIASAGTVSVTSATLDNNRASGAGGGMYISGGSATITFVSLVNNQSSGGGAGLHGAGGTVNLRNSLLASSDSDSDCAFGSGMSLNENVGNLIADNSCAPAASGDPQLLQARRIFVSDSWSFPRYYPIPSTSPAVGIGLASICANAFYALPLNLEPRPASNCDAGAYEHIPVVRMRLSSSCALADAITAANTDTATNGCPAGQNGRDIISLRGDENLSSALPDISSRMEIEGSGYTMRDTVNGADNNLRFFNISSAGNLTIRNLTLEGGSPASGDGGAVANAGRFTAAHCTFKDNRTATGNSGGAVHSAGASSQAFFRTCAFIDNVSGSTGGAVNAASSAYFANVTLANNSSAGHGGAVYTSSGNTIVQQSTFYNNQSSSNSYTTGIHRAGGSVYLRNSIVARDSSLSSGGPLCTNNFSESRGNVLSEDSCRRNGQSAQDATSVVADPKLGLREGKPGYYPLLPGSPALGLGIATTCAQTDSHQDIRGAPRPRAGCDSGAWQFYIPAPERELIVKPTAPPAAQPAPVCTGERLNESGVFKVSTTYGLCTGVQFNQLELSAIGIGYIVEAGPIAAVDVWGWVTATVEVCYRGRVSALFLDAAHSPRAVSQLASVWDGEWTCAQISRAGTIVLMPADSYLTTPPVDAAAPESPPAGHAASQLHGAPGLHAELPRDARRASHDDSALQRQADSLPAHGGLGRGGLVWSTRLGQRGACDI